MTDWPVELRGVTESVVTTKGPDGQWNVAALGLHAESGGASVESTVRARTWGRTRTRRNFEDRGGGYVQFTRDPVAFVEAALSVWERSDPVIDSADAWVRVSVDRLEEGESDGTEWVDWRVRPQASTVECEVVPRTNRGYNAVVEATVAASRLDVESYETDTLRSRLDYFRSVAKRCGGDREREAVDRLDELLER